MTTAWIFARSSAVSPAGRFRGRGAVSAMAGTGSSFGCAARQISSPAITASTTAPAVSSRGSRFFFSGAADKIRSARSSGLRSSAGRTFRAYMAFLSWGGISAASSFKGSTCSAPSLRQDSRAPVSVSSA